MVRTTGVQPSKIMVHMDLTIFQFTRVMERYSKETKSNKIVLSQNVDVVVIIIRSVNGVKLDSMPMEIHVSVTKLHRWDLLLILNKIIFLILILN